MSSTFKKGLLAGYFTMAAGCALMGTGVYQKNIDLIDAGIVCTLLGGAIGIGTGIHAANKVMKAVDRIAEEAESTRLPPFRPR